MTRLSLRSLLPILALSLLPASALHAQTKLLRFPDIHDSRVVFCYAGDLWLAPAAGGDATRLTAHPGQELFPKFSPDGRSIAFTGQYDGDEQVYVIPTAGGPPKQLTYYPAHGPLAPRWGYDNQVYGWSRDGKSVLFRSMRDGWDLTDTRLYTIPTTGGLPQVLPMPVSGAGDFSPDGKKVVYSPLVRDFRTWKRYQGGWAQDLFIFDLATHDAVQITEHPRSDRDPMWIGERIYFSSDRDGTLNLYSYDPATKTTQQLTRSSEWDVRWPSADASRIVYELNGELRVYDVASGKSTAISIRVPDDGLASRPSQVAAGELIEDYGLSPNGKRALFVARGDVFTAPIEKGPTRNLTRSSNAHDKGATWSPDGSKIAFISDGSGEEEIYLVDQDGKSKPQQLTDNGDGMRYTPKWSPDGKHLLFTDKEGRVFVLTIAGKKLVEIANERQGQVNDYTWSPDSRYVAVSLVGPNTLRSIHIWSMSDGRLRRVTDELFNQTDPTWGPHGDYLYFFSDREFQPQIGSFEFNYVVDRETGIFALALRKDVKNPFPPESDEVTSDDKDDGNDENGKDGKKEKDKSKKKPQAPEPFAIDFDGIEHRVSRVPVEADNYWGLGAIDGHLIYVRGAPFYYGRDADNEPDLLIYSLEDREETTLVEDIAGYALSPDGSKILVRKGSKYELYDAKPKAKDPKTVSTAGLRVDRIPAEEWAEIFDEVWRRFRDFFYVENMHGYDWVALGNRYRDLLEYVGHRSDLNYVIGEMIAELNVSHAYIWGGDYEVPERPRVALPGALFELDKAAGRYRISRILAGQNEEERYRSPLTEIGVDAHVGHYVLAIDGEELRADDNPFRLLRHKADQPVTFTLNSSPAFAGSHDVTFQPITEHRSLFYLDWVTRNREKVAAATDGRVGYIHVPDMGSNGIREFIKYFYGQIRKDGLIIDVRGNGGGNVSQMLIERLRRKMLRTRFVRTYDDPLTYPSVVFNGRLVCVLNETSASDGDIFPAMFKAAGLGPLIGKRSWGGVTGITSHGPLLDGGSVRVPQFGTNSLSGEWMIEGHGVDPDIEVENDPKSVIEGRDNQLDRAITEITRLIREDPPRFPDRPADPIRTK